MHNCDTKSLDNININYRQRRQGRRRRRSRCDDQLSVSSFASAESTGTDVIVRTPLPKHTDFSTLLARWHDVAQRLGREREMEMDKQTSWSMPRPGSRCRSQIRRLGLGSGLKLELEGDGSGRQSQLKVRYNSWIDRMHFCFPFNSVPKGVGPGGITLAALL